MKSKYQYIITVYFIIFICLSVFAKPKYKEIDIQGNKIYKDSKLINTFKLNRIPYGQKYFRIANTKIKRYYRSKGYSLVRIYLIEENKDKISIYIDEGRMGQIRIIDFNYTDTAKIKFLFSLPKKTYNKNIIYREKREIKKKLKIDVDIKLVKIENYDKAFFQIDNEFQIPGVGETKLPFFEKYGYRYNLEIKKETKKSRKNKSKSPTQIKFDYGFKSNIRTSHTPWLSVKKPNIINKNDFLKAKLSLGYNYQIEEYSKKPIWSITQFESQYYPITKTKKQYFKPRVNLDVTHSTSSRQDIGIEQYEYILTRSIFEPGVKFFNYFNFYLGVGFEKDYIAEYTFTEDTNSDVNVGKETPFWYLLTCKLEVSEVFNFLEDNNLFLDIKTEYYFDEDRFYKLYIQAGKNFKFKNGIKYKTGLQFKNAGLDIPFYHDLPVKDSYFRGSSFSQHKTHINFSNRNEVKFSIYKEFWYIGWFTDFTIFEGYGLFLDGPQYGGATGPITDFLLFDQIEFSFLIGYDYLVSENNPGLIMSFSFRNKW